MNDYYEKITLDDYNNYIPLSIDEKLFNNIRSFVIKLERFPIDGIKTRYRGDIKKIFSLISPRIIAIDLTTFEHKSFMWIHLSRDEWFLVKVITNFSDYYYKCDQLDGLFECLKDKINDK